MSSPPRYSDEIHDPVKSSSVTEPLLGASSRTPNVAAAASGSVSAQRLAEEGWSDDDVANGLKLGPNVSDCDAEIRMFFIRKVYSILSVQLLMRTVVSVLLSLDGAKEFTHATPWLMWIPMILSFVSLGFVWWKRHHHPANLILLGLFTLFESVMIGLAVSYYESRIVLQALFITLGVFVGLTLFTFQTKYDFSSWPPILYISIWGLLTTSLISVFLPFNATFDLIIAAFSTLLFSGFVLYDTQQIMQKLSVDEAIVGALTLYLDFLNLFLSILRLLNNQNNR
ncbi:vacuolar protein [Cryptococcus wingfieldii CBS 7118]|uniref:Vacuolar protein n=1 Tax=Cryptococcus wingfieldii CBS 7118 TaxID=1295528 RepID=A0A1E3J4M1_9TREE|nr:vacuolar protein [Cryptococcus wingfieldii CBS 7118]ODN95794.1 vacuolar protein [Cryptococcus wingfieldii CBS 7118]